MTVSSLLAAAVLALQPSDAPPIVRGAHFIVQDLSQSEAVERETNIVPNRPQRSCYHWVIDVEPEERSVTVRELFILPGPAQQWGIAADQYTRVRQDQSGAVTQIEDSLADGRLTHGWCVAPGDPSGEHRIRVFVGRTLLHEFTFQVVGETY